jgi:hypothetical protein
MNIEINIYKVLKKNLKNVSEKKTVDSLPKDTAEIETGMAEKTSFGTRQKLGFVWRNRKKISQIINANLYLPFFLLIILWFRITTQYTLHTA